MLYDVDTWQGSDEQAHDSLDFSSIEKYYDFRFTDNKNITKCKMTSDEFFSKTTHTFNFIYIDGDHTALQTALDGLNAFKVLEPGGVMAFDDYEWGSNLPVHLAPKLGVNLFLHRYQGKFENLIVNGQVWLRKL
jgi:hypothetical protein